VRVSGGGVKVMVGTAGDGTPTVVDPSLKRSGPDPRKKLSNPSFSSSPGSTSAGASG
jgi:hypothetical protein